MTLVRGYRFAQPTATSRIIPWRGNHEPAIRSLRLRELGAWGYTTYPLAGNRESAIRSLRLRELGATGRLSAIWAWGLAQVFVKFDLKPML